MFTDHTQCKMKKTWHTWSWGARMFADGRGGYLWVRMGGVGPNWGLGPGKEAGRDTDGYCGHRLHNTITIIIRESRSGHEVKGWTGESMVDTQGTCLGLKCLSKGKRKRQRQEKEVKRQSEDSKSPQRHLHKWKKQTVKHVEKTNKKIKVNSTKTLSTKQMSPLVPKAHNTTKEH